MNYPLPPRPTTGPPGVPPKAANPALQPPQSTSTSATPVQPQPQPQPPPHPLPRSPFIHHPTTQPASPRPQTPLSASFFPASALASAANSPARPLPLALPLAAGSAPSPRSRQGTAGAAAAPAGRAWPERVRAEGLRVNSEVVRFGVGWAVEWRAWSGGSVMGNGGAAAGAAEARATQSGSRYEPGSSSQGSKAAAGRNLLDSLSAQGASSRPATPLASTSSHQPVPLKLKHKLESLHSLLGPDPIEAARAQLIAAATHLSIERALSDDPGSATSPAALGLFTHVEIAQEPAVEADTGKGKGRQSDYFGDAQGGVRRTLWVFRVIVEGGTGLGLGAMADAEAETSSSLANYEFPDLTRKHHPNLNSMTRVADLDCPVSQRSARASSPTETFTRLCTLPRRPAQHLPSLQHQPRPKTKPSPSPPHPASYPSPAPPTRSLRPSNSPPPSSHPTQTHPPRHPALAPPHPETLPSTKSTPRSSPVLKTPSSPPSSLPTLLAHPQPSASATRPSSCHRRACRSARTGGGRWRARSRRA